MIDKITVRSYQMKLELTMSWYVDNSNSIIENIKINSEYKLEIWL